MEDGAKTEPIYQTCCLQEDGDLGFIQDDDGTKVYATGSLAKLLIAVALHLIVDVHSKSEKPEHRQYKALYKWDLRYVDVLNECAGKKIMENLRGNPTLDELLIHLKGLPDVNHFLLAPDGAPLLSREDFIDLASLLNKHVERKDPEWVEYSNGNYILIGILIEIASGKSLGEFLEAEIFKPLKMYCTYVDLQNVPASLRVRPYLIDRDGKRKEARNVSRQSDVVEVAALGIYSCTRDLGRLYRSLLPLSKDNRTHRILTHESLLHLHGYNDTESRTSMSNLTSGTFDDENWTPAGLVTTDANGFRLGSRLINRLLLPNDEVSAFALGTDAEKPDLEVCSQAGSVSTFTCAAYFIANTNTVIVVTNNTLGQGDAADLVTRRLLQSRLMLNAKFSPLELDIVDKAVQGSGRYLKSWSKKWQICETIGTPTESEIEMLQGAYEDDQFAQCLEIGREGNQLRIQFRGKDKRSSEMRLASIGAGKLMICPEEPGIDWFDAWKDLELRYERDADTGQVSHLLSTVELGGKPYVIKYMPQASKKLNPGP